MERKITWKKKHQKQTQDHQLESLFNRDTTNISDDFHSKRCRQVNDTNSWRCSFGFFLGFFFFVNQVNHLFFPHPRSVKLKPSLSTTCEGSSPSQTQHLEQRHSTSFSRNQPEQSVDKWQWRLTILFLLSNGNSSNTSFNRLCSGSTVRCLHDELLNTTPFNVYIECQQKHW